MPDQDTPTRRSLLQQTALIAGAAALAGAKAGAQTSTTDQTPCMRFFPSSFRNERIKTSGAEINTVIGGSGPPMLLFHGGFDALRRKLDGKKRMDSGGCLRAAHQQARLPGDEGGLNKLRARGRILIGHVVGVTPLSYWFCLAPTVVLLRPVYGIAGNFILGPSVARGVLSQAFSGSLGLLKTASTLAAFDAQGHMLASTNAASGPALFAFSPDGAPALVYLPSNNTLIEWAAGKFEILPYRPGPGIVLAIALPNAFEASLVVQRSDGIWQVQLPFTRSRIDSQKAVPGVTAPVLAIASGDLVYADAKGIVLRKPDNSELHIAVQLPAKFSLTQMDSDWVQLSDLASPRRYAVRLTPGREGFYQLPEAAR